MHTARWEAAQSTGSSKGRAQEGRQGAGRAGEPSGGLQNEGCSKRRKECEKEEELQSFENRLSDEKILT